MSPSPEEIQIRRMAAGDRAEWLRLRTALWPRHTPEELEEDLDTMAVDPLQPVFVADRSDGRLAGLVEIALRESAPGCTTSPVGYVEGWYVDPDLRHVGIGRRLVEAGEAWARARGCREMASDTTEDYPLSPRAHAALGYEEAGDRFHFRKTL